MKRRKESRGTCAFCGEEIAMRSVTRHLQTCARRLERIAAADTSQLPGENLLHLRVQDAYTREYWLDLEMNGSATLDKLDKYLRAIWLECCGHLSQFTVGGWGGREIGKARKAKAVFAEEVVLRHQYDFGTTSETDVRLVGSRSGKPLSKHPITLMARNNQPQAVCQECGQPASWICIECQEEEGNSGYLCEDHVEGHPHEDYGEPMRVVNSPRMGMCAYDGPAEPPY